MSSLILHAAGVHKTYLLGQDKVHVLRGASISVHRGEFVAIMGASGSGKSTLLHLLGALDVPDRGTVTFEGQNVFGGSASERDRYRNLHFGFVFQFYHLLPELNTLENVLLPTMVRFGLFDWFKERSKLNRRAAEVLELMGLKDRFRHRPNELSGGERQRVAIGRALINEPQVLLADEPTGNLDARTGEGILGLLKALNEKGQTVVMVTHDPKVASAAHRTVTLADGRIKALDE
ncbi:MAG: ABC transporter ATP-binding protein [Phycisphaerae bacterium]|nr:ABC transporter ATP-binding protein [Phycisphaerae bacterium]